MDTQSIEETVRDKEDLTSNGGGASVYSMSNSDVQSNLFVSDFEGQA